MKHALNAVLCRVNGSLDIDASLEQFRLALTTLQATEVPDEEIASAVAQLWADNSALKGVSLGALATATLPYFAASGRTIPLGAIEDVQNQVKEYVRGNTDTFYVSRGRQSDGGGAVRLVSRMTDEQKKAMVKARAEAAKKAAELAAESA